MLKAILLFIVGFVCLIKGGDWFVDGATGIARRFHLPEILIGATVVSIGTTLPEVMVSTTSAIAGHSQIAYGNAIGSVICNTALIAAVPILVRPGLVNRRALITPVAFFFASAVFFAIVAYAGGFFSRFVGIALLTVFLIYMVLTVFQMRKEPEDKTDDEIVEKAFYSYIIFLVCGAALIAVGAHLLVDNGTFIAKELGVPETVIALTFVALGTSLPELITAITALVKGHSALSLGNVIGANLFNIVLVCGMSITVRPFPVPHEATLFGRNASLVLDIPVMFAVMLLLTVPALIQGKLRRWQGAALLGIYAVFCFIQFVVI